VASCLLHLKRLNNIRTFSSWQQVLCYKHQYQYHVLKIQVPVQVPVLCMQVQVPAPVPEKMYWSTT